MRFRMACFVEMGLGDSLWNCIELYGIGVKWNCIVSDEKITVVGGKLSWSNVFIMY